MSNADRKLRRNLGNFPLGAPTQLTNAAVLLVERILKRLFDTAVQQLLANKEDAVRYFSHFFDTTMGSTERDEFIRAFYNTPPKTVLGYARAGAELPCYAIVLASEEETDSFLADLVESDHETKEFIGAFFEATYSVYVYATHPDMAQVLYQIGKAILHTGKGLLMHEGALQVTIGGGELAPDESYMPENMFVRVLRVSVGCPYSAPQFLPTDPAKLKTLIYAHDITVDGMRGGVFVKDEDELK